MIKKHITIQDHMAQLRLRIIFHAIFITSLKKT